MAIELSEKQIRDGWQIVKFGEIAKEVKLTTKNPAEDGLEFYVGLDHLDPQSLRIARKGIIAEDNPSFTRRFSAGQILFGKRRCYQKKAAVADFDGICSGDIIVMDATPKKIIPGLLPFIIQSDTFFDWAEKTSSGSLSPRTKWKSLAEYEFPLPPIERQKEILEVLEKVEEVEGQQYQTLGSLKLFKLVSQKRLLLQGLKVDDLKDTAIGKIPKHWTIAPLGSHSYIKGRIGWKNLKRAEYTENGPFLIAGKHVSNGKISWNECDHITEERYQESIEIALENGDVIFSKDGSLGNPALIDNLEKKATINSTMMLVRANNKTLHPGFLYQIIASVLFQKKIKQLTSGSSIPHIFQRDMDKFLIPLPPYKEQKEISKMLFEFDIYVYENEKKYYHIKKLKNGLINKIMEVSNELQ